MASNSFKSSPASSREAKSRHLVKPSATAALAAVTATELGAAPRTVAPVIVAAMLQRAGLGGHRAGRERRIAQVDEAVGYAFGVWSAAHDTIRARTEHGEITAGIDQAAGAALGTQGFDGSVDRESLGDAAQIDVHRRAHAGAMLFDEIHIRQPSRSRVQTWIENAPGAAV